MLSAASAAPVSPPLVSPAKQVITFIVFIIIIIIIIITRFREVLGRYRVVNRPRYRGPASTDCRDRGSHARGVYPSQDTSRMGTATVKQEEEADTRIIAKEEEEQDTRIIVKRKKPS